MESDRNAFEKLAGDWPSVQKAVERITTEMKADKSEGSYYYSWQANIAMAFKDEADEYIDQAGTALMSRKDFHDLANTAAKRFLDLLIRK